jgi:CRP-like cAMP-binding protein
LAKEVANGITAKNQIVFSQGDPSDAVFYVEGKVKVTVVSEQGKDAVVAILGANDFSAKLAWPDRRSASRPSQQ